jgi:hypothetical protein
MAYPSGTGGIQIITKSDVGKNTSHEYEKRKGDKRIISYSIKGDNRQLHYGSTGGPQIPNPGKTYKSHARGNRKPHNKKKEEEETKTNQTYDLWRHLFIAYLSV